MPFPKVVEKFRCVFFDAYGVLNGAGGLFPWVADSIDNLRKLNIPFYVVSNDSSNLISGIVKKLTPKGRPSPFDESQIISSGLICQNYIAKNLNGKTLVYFGEEQSIGYLQNGGDVIHIRDISTAESADAFVVLGCGGMDWRTGLDKSVNFLRANPTCELLAPNPDLLFYAGESQVGIAAGSLAGLIERAIHRPFHYFGKPHRVIFEFAYAKVQQDLDKPINPHDILMVGDNMFTDIPGAKDMGFKSCLVLSGNTTSDNFESEKMQAGMTPDFVCESIAF